jgi:hypothetical protein
VTTAAAILTVTVPNPAAPVVTSEPVSTSVPGDAIANFTAAASGSPVPTVQWQVSMNSGASWGNVGGASAASYSFTALASENGFEYEAVFTNASGTATTDPVTLTVSGALGSSGNWSGYLATGATFSGVSASWVVPTAICQPGQTAYSSAWIGIDGGVVTSDTVEQDGTESDCTRGTAVYDAWYEMFGDSSVNGGAEVELSPTTYPVAPGDLINASVTVTSGEWTLAVADATAGWTFSTFVVSASPPPDQASAEWIVERPGICNRFGSCPLGTLDDFGSVTFSDATASAGSIAAPISAYTNTGVAMEATENGSTVVLANPGNLASGGEGFIDVYESS